MTKRAMTKGALITALDANDRAAANLSQVCRDANDEDIQHAALYAATDGSGNLEDRNLQAKRFKSLRTTLIRERGVTVKWNSKTKQFYIDKVGTRDDSKAQAHKGGKKTGKLASTAPNIEASKPKTDTETGNRSKPAPASLQKMENKISESLTNKTDLIASIARQMKRAGISLDELAEYIADNEAVDTAA